MAQNGVLTLTGEENVLAFLHTFSAKVQTRIVKGAVRTAMKPVLATLKASLPRKTKKQGNTGNLRRGASWKVKTYKSATVSLVGYKHNVAPHSHLWELGTKERFRNKIFWQGRPPAVHARLIDAPEKSTGKNNKAGGYTGRMVGRQTLRQAYRSNASAVVSSLRNAIRAALVSELAGVRK